MVRPTLAPLSIMTGTCSRRRAQPVLAVTGCQHRNRGTMRRATPPRAACIGSAGIAGEYANDEISGHTFASCAVNTPQLKRADAPIRQRLNVLSATLRQAAPVN